MKREQFEQRAAEMKLRMRNERQSGYSQTPVPSPSRSECLVLPSGIERHYRVRDIVELLGYSSRTVRRLFDREPGIVILPRSTKRGKGAYKSYTVPESVLRRVLSRLTRVTS